MIEHGKPVQTTKKRRLHPVRRIARWLLNPQRSGHQEVDYQRICRGPSILQNLLPFLEPFITLDPKLQFVEDRIIGRTIESCPTSPVKLPSSINELEVWVKEAAPACHCDECAPKSYRLEGRRTHGRIRYQELERKHRSRRFTRVAPPNSTATPPPPGLSLKLYGDYEAMHLVRHHIAWLDHTYLDPSRPCNVPNVSQLISLLHVWQPNLAAPDLRSTTSTSQLHHLFQHLNAVFFAGAVPPHRAALSNGFAWLPPTNTTCFGIGSFSPLIGTQILLHPTLYRHTPLAPATDPLRSRIGTLLHEMCHAYLKAYSCRSCPMHHHAVGPLGHGHAWHLLAAKIELVATRLLGGVVNLGRFPALLHDLHAHGRLPSQHDLRVYALGRDLGSFSPPSLLPQLSTGKST